MLERTLTVRVASIRRLTADVSAFELVHPWGRTLPGYRAGAHIDVHLPGGFTRQYSLASAAPPVDQANPGCARYVIGVKREPASRGGSAALHERVHEGDLLPVSTPRSTFALHAQARHHLLLAGGIGLTPLLAMAEQLQREGASFALAVFARSRAHLAFADALAALGPRVKLHFDEPASGPDAQHLDLAKLLREHRPGTHLYLCGPGGFMQAVLAAAAHWPEDSVHLEYFAPPAAEGAEGQTGRDEPFTLVVAGPQRSVPIVVPVAADQSAVDALHDLGIDVPTSCSQGVCGTCAVTLTGGDPDHRDHCLSATERRSRIALCCSRAKAGGRIVVEIG
jgi:vanillate O-demethylase ferredoxin subunit